MYLCITCEEFCLWTKYIQICGERNSSAVHSQRLKSHEWGGELFLQEGYLVSWDNFSKMLSVAAKGQEKVHCLGRCEKSILEKGETASVPGSFRVNLGMRLGIGTRERVGNKYIILLRIKYLKAAEGKCVCMGKRLSRWIGTAAELCWCNEELRIHCCLDCS